MSDRQAELRRKQRNDMLKAKLMEYGIQKNQQDKLEREQKEAIELRKKMKDKHR